MELTGTIYKINETEQISDKFRKRSFILETPGQYPQYPALECVQDKCELLDNFSVGQQVTVQINVNGRMYKDKNTGEEKSFTSLQAWKIDAGSGEAEAPQDTEAGTHNWETAPASASNTQSAGNEDDDLPF